MIDLRDYEAGDYPLLKAIFQDELVMRYTLDGVFPETRLEEYFSRILRNNAMGADRKLFEFKVLEDGRYLGFADIEIIRSMPGGGIAEIGYFLLPEHWNKGHTTSIARALVAKGFDDLGLHKIVASCTEDNVGSWRVMEKAGMSREARLIRHRYVLGEFRNELKYAVLRELPVPPIDGGNRSSRNGGRS